MYGDYLLILELLDPFTLASEAAAVVAADAWEVECRQPREFSGVCDGENLSAC